MRFINGLPVYAVGTKVRLVKNRKHSGVVVGVNLNMESNWFGSVVTIKAVHFDNQQPYYDVEENDWVWDDSLIEGVEIAFCEEDDEEIEGASFGKFFDGYTIMKGNI